MAFHLTYAELFRFGAEYKDGSGGGPLRGLTYRPRSVSSLLILLSAMLLEVYLVSKCKLTEVDVGENERFVLYVRVSCTVVGSILLYGCEV